MTVLGDRKKRAQKCAKTCIFQENCKKMTLILEAHECRKHCKTQEKAKTQWHGEYDELNCLPKPCVSHPMSSIWTPRTDKTRVQFRARRDVWQTNANHWQMDDQMPQGPLWPEIPATQSAIAKPIELELQAHLCMYILYLHIHIIGIYNC